MSYHAFSGPQFLSEAVARNLCPTCGQPGVEWAPGELAYHLDGGVAKISHQASIYRCPDCGILFAREEK